MGVELTFLGTGTSAGVPMIGCRCEVCASDDPRDNRTRPSVLIRYARQEGDPLASDGPDERGGAASGASACAPWQFLIDTTPELRTQTIRHGVERLDAVFLTHAHADHVMGLDDLRRFNAVMRRHLDLYAEPRTLDRVARMFSYIFEPEKNVNDTFIAQLAPTPLMVGEPVSFGPARWTPLRLYHGNLPILGYRVDVDPTPGDSNGHVSSVAYCTDVSRIPDESLQALQGLDVLVLDALRYREHPTHMTVEQALAAIESIRPKRAYLTHIAHDISHAELDPQLPDGVSLAYDGLVIGTTDANRSPLDP